MVTEDELSYVKSHMDFWEHLTPQQKDIFVKNISKVSFSKGYNLHSFDQECLGVLLIKSGELRVYILSEDGREVTLFRLRENEICILSASCILNSITFDVNIDAQTDTEVYLLNIGAFSRLCSGNIYVENFAYKNAMESFSDVMWAVEQILFMRFDKRLATFLLDEMTKTNSSQLNLTQEQIARYVGSAREVVSRMLKSFQTKGILEQSRGVITILDKKKLKELLL